MHAVSVGEVLSTVELLKKLRVEIPSAPLLVSVTTLAGRAIADEKLRSLADGVFYAPLDFVFVIRRVLRRLRPRILVVAETEIWPNLFREVKRAGCGLIVVNGRISDEAAPRYRKWRWFFRHVLQWPDAILAQNIALRERFLALGAPPEKATVGGSPGIHFGNLLVGVLPLSGVAFFSLPPMTASSAVGPGRSRGARRAIAGGDAKRP